MSIEMTKRKEYLFLFAVMLANFVGMGEMIVTPIINNIYMAYPENIGAVNTIVSAPSLLTVVGTLIVASLLQVWSKKKALLVGSIIFSSSGLLCGIVTNVWWFVVLRLIYGLGLGFVTVAAVAVITEIYTDESRRATIMGYYNASMSIVGITLTFFSGVLATTYWKKAFGLYLLTIPMMIIFILFIPSIGVVKEKVSNDIIVKKERGKLGKGFIQLALDFFFFNLANGVCLYFLSVYIAENQLGNEAFAGTAAAVMTLAGLPFCILFGKIYNLLKGKSGFVMYGLAGVAMAAMFLNASRIQVIITYAMLGIAYGYMYAYVSQRATVIVPLRLVDKALGYINAVYAFGSFCATYFASLVMGLMGTERITPVYFVVGMIAAFVAIMELVTNRDWKAERIEE